MTFTESVDREFNPVQTHVHDITVILQINFLLAKGEIVSASERMSMIQIACVLIHETFKTIEHYFAS